MNHKIPRLNQLLIGILIFSVMIIANSIVIIFSPIPFIRIVLLITTIGVALAIGAFIREIVLIKKKL